MLSLLLLLLWLEEDGFDASCCVGEFALEELSFLGLLFGCWFALIDGSFGEAGAGSNGGVLLSSTFATS